MERGKVLMIYFDPETEHVKEGGAKLLSLISKDDKFEYWRVIFNNRDICSRRIKINGRNFK